jgi:hypothetical protein
MAHRPILLTLAVILSAFVSLSGQGRGLAGIVAVEAPVMLLPEDGRTPLATLSAGTRVEVLDAPEEGWYRISFQDNYLFGDRVGFVRAELVRVNGRVPGASPERALTPGAGHKALPDSNTPATTSTAAGTALRTNRGPAAPAIEPKAVPAARTPRAGMSESSIATAIILGQRQRGGSDGLQLLDTGGAWTRANSASGETGSRFRLQIHTPLAWIQQQASEAARSSRKFTLDDVTDEMTEPVLRVVAYAASGITKRSWVRHIELRIPSRRLIVQPLTKEPFSEHVLKAAGGSTVSEGMRVTFPLEAVRRLADPAGDTEFFITVTGATGEKRDVRITRSHLAALPM